MLMSQISPHFIFNTVNSIRIMAIKEGQDRAGGMKTRRKHWKHWEIFCMQFTVTKTA